MGGWRSPPVRSGSGGGYTYSTGAAPWIGEQPNVPQESGQRSTEPTVISLVSKPLLMDATDAPEQPSKSSKDEPEFDPSRMIGIIKRKALIKELAAAYHAKCLACCQKLLQLQRKWEEEQQHIKRRNPEVVKQTTKPSKRQKKGP